MDILKIDKSKFSQKVKELMKKQFEAKRKTLDRIGTICEGAAKDRAPFKEGFLTSDIRSELQQDGDLMGAVIGVHLNATSSEYAVAMHEDDYNLGPGSLAKQSKVGVRVGDGYILRGVLDSREEIKREILDKMRL